MDELLKLLVVITRLGHTFPFCYNSSSHPSVPSYHSSPSYGVTNPFSLIFCLIRCQLHPLRAGSYEAVCALLAGGQKMSAF